MLFSPVDDASYSWPGTPAGGGSGGGGCRGLGSAHGRSTSRCGWEITSPPTMAYLISARVLAPYTIVSGRLFTQGPWDAEQSLIGRTTDRRLDPDTQDSNLWPCCSPVPDRALHARPTALAMCRYRRQSTASRLCTGQAKGASYDLPLNTLCLHATNNLAAETNFPGRHRVWTPVSIPLYSSPRLVCCCCAFLGERHPQRGIPGGASFTLAPTMWTPMPSVLQITLSHASSLCQNGWDPNTLGTAPPAPEASAETHREKGVN